MIHAQLRKEKSNINGFGIFTTFAISKGQEFYTIPLKTVYSEPHPKCARIADGKYVHDNEVLDWVNHSCNPSAILDINREYPVLRAIRNIVPGEEISVDYNQTEVQGVTAQCTCKADNCKGYFVRL